jgi:hypothetical protein
VNSHTPNTCITTPSSCRCGTANTTSALFDRYLDAIEKVIRHADHLKG